MEQNREWQVVTMGCVSERSPGFSFTSEKGAAELSCACKANSLQEESFVNSLRYNILYFNVF